MADTVPSVAEDEHPHDAEPPADPNDQQPESYPGHSPGRSPGHSPENGTGSGRESEADQTPAPSDAEAAQSHQHSAEDAADREDERYAQLLAYSWQAFHTDECQLGTERATSAVAIKPDDGRGYYILACLYERDGKLIAADRSFRRAAACDHEPHPAPFRLSWRHFERSVARAAEQLPRAMQTALGELDLVLTDYPGSETPNSESSYEMLGLFSGPSKADRLNDRSAGGDLELSARIYLYRRAHEHIAGTALEFDDEVQRTLYHELGHYLGFDEADLKRLGLD